MLNIAEEFYDEGEIEDNEPEDKRAKADLTKLKDQIVGKVPEIGIEPEIWPDIGPEIESSSDESLFKP